MHDSHPLIAGQDGTVFVYSGGVLMKLTSDLTSASKVASMRQELWLTEGDEGTPQFPDILGVYGVYQGRIYRGLSQNFGGGGWLIRRLEVTAMLRAPRKEIRRLAPKLWPNLTEHKVFDINDPDPDAPKPICGGNQKSVRPLQYNEDDRDKWDGDCRWIWDAYLWEGLEMPSPEELPKDAKSKGKGKVKGKDKGEGCGKGKSDTKPKRRKGKGKGNGKDTGKGKTKDKPKWRPKEPLP